MSDQLRRQIEILKLLPRPGLAKSTAEIFKELEALSDHSNFPPLLVGHTGLQNLGHTTPKLL